MRLFEVLVVVVKKLFSRGCIIDIHARLSMSTQFVTSGKGRIWTGRGFTTKRNVTVHAAEDGRIEIGNNVFMNENINVVAHDSISIGDNVTIGPNTVIYDHDHSTTQIGEFTGKPIVIGRGVWIGSNVVILKGITIGENSIVGAGTVLTKSVPPNSIVYSHSELVIKEVSK